MKARYLDINELFLIINNYMLYTQQNDDRGVFSVCDIKAIQDLLVLKSASNGYVTVADNVLNLCKTK